MSWKFVFNTGFMEYKAKEEAAALAALCGYKFFTWDESVLHTTNCDETGILVADLI